MSSIWSCNWNSDESLNEITISIRTAHKPKPVTEPSPDITFENTRHQTSSICMLVAHNFPSFAARKIKTKKCVNEIPLRSIVVAGCWWWFAARMILMKKTWSLFLKQINQTQIKQHERRCPKKMKLREPSEINELLSVSKANWYAENEISLERELLVNVVRRRHELNAWASRGARTSLTNCASPNRC